MNKVYYLEPDEEITKIVDRIRKTEEDGVVLVISRGSTIAQSIINLKLLQRNAKEHKKGIGIVSTDQITKNLADQLNIPVFAKASQAEKADLAGLISPKNDAENVDPEESPVKVNKYKKYDLSQVSAKDRKDEPEEKEVNEESFDDDLGDVDSDTTDNSGDSESADYQNDAEDEEDEGRAEAEEYLRSREEKSDKFQHRDLPSPKEDERPHEKSDKEERMHLGNGSQHREKSAKKKKIIKIVAGVLIILLAVSSIIFLPSVQASVILKTEDISKKATFTVDQNQKQADIGNLTIPGQLVELSKDETKTFSSTGTKDAGSKATGTITISNGISTKSIPVSPGTKVTSSDGKVFTINSGVMVPGMTNVQISDGKVTSYDAGTVDASVTASANGDDYNLAANTKFTVSSMTATNKSAFSGGATKNILYVTETDLTNAEKAIKDTALTDNKVELLANAAKSSLTVVEDYISVDIVSIDANKKANDEADTFQITAKVRLSVLGFSTEELKAATIEYVNSGLSSGQMLVNPEQNDPTYEVNDFDASTNILKLDVTFTGKVGAKLSSDALAGKIKNKSLDAAKSYLLSENGVDSVEITSKPSFWQRTPLLANRITINFDYQK